jgi:hypothetical protein
MKKVHTRKKRWWLPLLLPFPPITVWIHFFFFYISLLFNLYK